MTKQIRVIPTLLLLTMLGNSALYAQQDEDAAASNDASAEQEASEDEELILTNSEDPEDAETPAPPVATNEDFNPSVQISEDLSVSFPVDI